MSSENDCWSKETVVVVTGANRGIGLEICRQVADKGLRVVLTARNPEKGLSDSARAFLEEGRENVYFHILDITRPESVSDFVDWLKQTFGFLDILVNNAGVATIEFNWELIHQKNIDMRTLLFLGREEVRQQMSKVDNLSKESIDEMVETFLEEAKCGKDLSSWSSKFSAYIVSKLALNAYTRVLARDLEGKACVNSVHPGYVKTDMTLGTGDILPTDAAANVLRVALFPPGGPSGCNFLESQESGF